MLVSSRLGTVCSTQSSSSQHTLPCGAVILWHILLGNRLNTQQTMTLLSSESLASLPDLGEQIIASVLDALELALKSAYTVAVRDLDSSHPFYRMHKQLNLVYQACVQQMHSAAKISQLAHLLNQIRYVLHPFAIWLNDHIFVFGTLTLLTKLSAAAKPNQA